MVISASNATCSSFLPLMPPQNRTVRILVHTHNDIYVIGSTAVPGVHFGEVRARIALADVLDLLGFVPCESSGDQVRGPCPVHRSVSPSSRSFSANLKLHVYRCFKCGSSGHQLDLYVAVTGLGLFAAAVALCEQLHRDISWVVQGKSVRPRTANRFVPDQPRSHDAGARQAGKLT